MVMANEALTDERLERLIAAQEATTNAIVRLVQVLEGRRAKRLETKAARSRRRPVADAPIAITPAVSAQVNRALARLGHRT